MKLSPTRTVCRAILLATTAMIGAAAPAYAADEADLATLRETNACQGCDLSEAFLRFRELNGADMTGANLFDAFFLETTAVGAIFVGADMTQVGTDNTLMREANFENAILVEANFTDTDLRDTNLTNADLSGATFTNAILSRANLTGANLTGASLDRSSLSGANLTDADLTNATFARMSITDAIFCRTTMPDGTVNNDGCP